MMTFFLGMAFGAALGLWALPSRSPIELAGIMAFVSLASVLGSKFGRR